MFPRKERLSRAHFPLALRGAIRRDSPHFSVRIPKVGSGYAVIVPKKVARLSVARHRIKRRVLEALRSIERPEAVIVFPQAQVAAMPYDEIIRELKTLLSTTNR